MRRWWTIAAVVLLVGSGLAAASTYLPIWHTAAFVVVASAPYLVFGAVVAGLILAVGRRWLLAGLSLVVVVAVLGPELVRSHRTVEPAGGGSLRVLTVNLTRGSADPDAFVALTREHADLVSVQELTPLAERRLTTAGMDDAFPYRVLFPHQTEPPGVGIWSRYPMVRIDPDADKRFAIVTAEVSVPGTSTPVTMVSLRIGNPISSSLQRWRYGVDRTTSELRELALRPGCVIVAGDFNSTPNMSAFQSITATGFTESRSGLASFVAPTFVSLDWILPTFAIDHVLTRGCSATAPRTLSVINADHRALVADVTIPPS